MLIWPSVGKHQMNGVEAARNADTMNGGARPGPRFCAEIRYAQNVGVLLRWWITLFRTGAIVTCFGTPTIGNHYAPHAIIEKLPEVNDGQRTKENT